MADAAEATILVRAPPTAWAGASRKSSRRRALRCCCTAGTWNAFGPPWTEYVKRQATRSCVTTWPTSPRSKPRDLAERILSEHDRLDGLVINAGIIVQERKESEDGYELTFAVNYLSHFLLTRLLLPLLKDSAPARIVNVASAGQSPLDFSNLMLEHGYDAMKAYSQSKLAQVMFTFELAERLSDTGVSVNALHPASLMDTKMVKDTFGYTMSTVEEGADATVHLAASPELEGVTGRYFDGTREARADGQAYDKEARQTLWELSEELCGPLLEPAARR